MQFAQLSSVITPEMQESSARLFMAMIKREAILTFLIDPTPETTLFDIGAIRHELLQLLGVHVDVLTPNALPDSFRAKVINEARPV